MGTKLYVGNLPFNTTENELQELFSQAGAVQEVTLMQDRARPPGGGGRGYGGGGGGYGGRRDGGQRRGH
ncbi:MAG: hypothetical protein DME74_06385 [Verrucomicrobia bacterium]|nr:MAG: hypothetical protein DME74_06385 [Verrucomicrobiota bacterium]